MGGHGLIPGCWGIRARQRAGRQRCGGGAAGELPFTWPARAVHGDPRRLSPGCAPAAGDGLPRLARPRSTNMLTGAALATPTEPGAPRPGHLRHPCVRPVLRSWAAGWYDISVTTRSALVRSRPVLAPELPRLAGREAGVADPAETVACTLALPHTCRPSARGRELFAKRCASLARCRSRPRWPARWVDRGRSAVCSPGAGHTARPRGVAFLPEGTGIPVAYTRPAGAILLDTRSPSWVGSTGRVATRGPLRDGDRVGTRYSTSPRCPRTAFQTRTYGSQPERAGSTRPARRGACCQRAHRPGHSRISAGHRGDSEALTPLHRAHPPSGTGVDEAYHLVTSLCPRRPECCAR